MQRGLTGTYRVNTVFGESVKAFVPNALPPWPPLQLTENLNELLEEASLALGRLDGISAILPDPYLFIYSYVRKEAVLSSQIEGTQSSLSDLLVYEVDGAPGAPIADAEEVSSYVSAMELGLRQLRSGMPLSLRLIKDVHAELLTGGRGGTKAPGEFRRTQNWVGGSRPGNALYVPPPPELLMECLGSLENFIHDLPSRTRALVKSALAHVQFETIHPFLDGNGRVGRLLITLLLCSENILSQPMLYLSVYLKEHRDEYYDLLQRVRTTGAWEAWLEFFLTGVRDTAHDAVETARSLLNLMREDRERVQRDGGSGNAVHRVYAHLQHIPVTTGSRVAATVGVSIPTALAALRRLEGMGIVRELTGSNYAKVYAYSSYLDILNANERNP